jgi:hypothetical protein
VTMIVKIMLKFLGEIPLEQLAQGHSTGALFAL